MMSAPPAQYALQESTPHTSQQMHEATPGEPLDELIASIPTGPPPALPSKSPRRLQQRWSVPDGDSRHASSAPLRNSEQELDETIEALERSALEDREHRRISSFSSVGSSPAGASSSMGHRSSLSSRTTWSDAPPEYDELHPRLDPGRKRVSAVLSDADKTLLKAEYPDDEADLTKSRSLSSYSDIKDIENLDVQPPSVDSKILHVHARGMHPFRLPLPSKELEIQIANPDGTVAYISSRTKRSSADSSLSKPGFGEYVRTSYGGKTMITCRRADNIMTPFAMTGPSLRRRRSFTLPNSGAGEFEWRYANASVSGRHEERLILVQKSPRPSISSPIAVAAELDKAKRLNVRRPLSRSLTSTTLPTTGEELRPSTSSGTLSKMQKGKAPKMAPRVLAQFFRSDLSLQAYGNSSKRQASRAGVGGELVLEPGCTDLVPEEVVVATALVMIKREQDRLRMVQAAVIVTVLL